jgi:hypothetical protein
MADEIKPDEVQNKVTREVIAAVKAVPPQTGEDRMRAALAAFVTKPKLHLAAADLEKAEKLGEAIGIASGQAGAIPPLPESERREIEKLMAAKMQDLVKNYVTVPSPITGGHDVLEHGGSAVTPAAPKTPGHTHKR